MDIQEINDTSPDNLIQSHKESLLGFFEFIYDRQEIWHNRFVENQEFPWTEDEVLQEYKFCNVYRRLDKGTEYLLNTVIYNEELSMYDTVLNIIGYRFFNKVDFFERSLGAFFSTEHFDFILYEENLDAAKETHKIFSDAYMTTQHPFDKSYRWGDKHIQILHMLQDLTTKMEEYVDKIFSAESPKKSWKHIKSQKMIGSFLAYEIWTDLTYLTEFPWSDNDFANAGPGADWGIRLIFGVDKVTPTQAEDTMDILRDIQPSLFSILEEETGKSWENVSWGSGDNGQYLSLRNIEHSLCEYRKYLRLKDGEGKRRIFRHPQKD